MKHLWFRWRLPMTSTWRCGTRRHSRRSASCRATPPVSRPWRTRSLSNVHSCHLYLPACLLACVYVCVCVCFCVQFGCGCVRASVHVCVCVCVCMRVYVCVWVPVSVCDWNTLICFLQFGCGVCLCVSEITLICCSFSVVCVCMYVCVSVCCCLHVTEIHWFACCSLGVWCLVPAMGSWRCGHTVVLRSPPSTVTRSV